MHDKSRPTHQAKRPGKSLRQKRAEKKAKHAPASTSSVAPLTKR